MVVVVVVGWWGGWGGEQYRILLLTHLDPFALALEHHATAHHVELAHGSDADARHRHRLIRHAVAVLARVLRGHGNHLSVSQALSQPQHVAETQCGKQKADSETGRLVYLEVLEERLKRAERR